MVVYVIVGLVVVAVLWLAYRTFGGASSGPPDNAALLRIAAETASSLGTRLAGDGHGGPKRTPRRVADGCIQLLERVDAPALDAVQRSAYELLVGAVEQLSWAARIRESAAFQTNLGLQHTVDALRTRADDAVARASALLGSGAAKEVDGPA